MKKLFHSYAAWILYGLLAGTSLAMAQQVSTGRVTTAAPAYTNGTAAPLSLTPTGDLRVNASVTANTTAFSTAGAPTYAPNTTNPLSTDLNGALRVNASVTASAAALASTTPPTYSNGTTNPLDANLSGALRVSDSNFVGQGSTTSGQLGPLAQGAVTTSAPAYVNAQTSPLNMTTSGGLRVFSVNASGAGIQFGAGSQNTSTQRVVLATDQTSIPVTTPNLDIAQGSTTVGQTGPLIQASVSTGNPTYVSAQTSPLNQTTSGALRTALTQIGSSAPSNILTNNGIAGTGAQRVVIASDNTPFGINVSSALPAGTNNIGDVDIASAIPAGTNNIGSVNTIPIDGGMSNARILSAAGTNATLVKNAPGTVFEITGFTDGAVVSYLKLYNSASAPTCGSGSPVATYVIPASATGAGFVLALASGKSFSTGIGACLTGGMADSNTTATAAGTIVVNFTYK